MKSKHLVGKVTNSDGSNYWIIQNNNSPNNSMNHEHVESAFQSFNGSLGIFFFFNFIVNFGVVVGFFKIFA